MRPARTGATGQPPGEVRIIGGLFKRSRIPVAPRPGLRPTPDRVRETLFNWLGQDLSGWQVVDAFAGTGVLGLEAISRGASRVLAFEQDAELARRIETVRDRLQARGLSVQRGDALALLRGLPPASVQLVLLDPPFDSVLFTPALQAAIAALADPGWIYLEAPCAWGPDQLAPLGLELVRGGRAGAVHFHLLARRKTV